MPQLLMPNMVDAYNKGQATGRESRLAQLAGQAYNANPQQQGQLVGQMVGLDPRQGLAIGGALDQRNAAQQSVQNKKLNAAASYLLNAVRTNDPQKIDHAYQATRPVVESVTGQQLPPQFDPNMIPHITQLALGSGGVPQAPKPISVAPGSTLLNPDTMHPEYTAPQKQQLTYQHVPDGKGGYTLEAFDQNGRPVSTLGHQPHMAGPNKPPAGYKWNADGTLSPIKGGPADIAASGFDFSPAAITNMAWDYIEHGHTALSGLGRGKTALPIRKRVYNEVANIAKQAGISPSDLATQQGRVKAMQASMQNLQKQSDMIERNSETFRKNLDLMISIAKRINMQGAPAWNQFVLHVKNKYTADPDVAAYISAQKTAAQEYAKIASGAIGSSGSTVQAMEHAYNTLDSSYSLPQLLAIQQTLEQDVANQKQASEERLLNVAGRMQDLGIHHQYPGHSYEPQPQGQPQSNSGWSIQEVQ